MHEKLKVSIYADHPSISLSLKFIGEFLSRYGFEVSYKGDICSALELKDNNLNELAGRLAGAVVPDIDYPLKELNNISGSEAGEEIIRIKNGNPEPYGILYDGLWLQRILYELLNLNIYDGSDNDVLNIIFTSRLFGTFENRRYHARVLMLGVPALISTSGLVEAPAKPREYYYIKGGLIQSGRDTSELDELYRGRYVEYDDPKISHIMRSYVLQALMYNITGEAFCEDPACCLLNSHWQEEVLRVQYKSILCGKCSEAIKKYVDAQK